MGHKLTLTQRLVAQLGELWTVEDAMREWWQSIHGGWRLSTVGFDTFEQLNLEHWDFEIPFEFAVRPSVLLALDRKMHTPYYLHIGKRPRLCFFDSKAATMYSLYGSIDRFVHGLVQH
jgi:hypothetical protein